MTYNISIHKACSSYTGLDTFSSRFVRLQNIEEFNRVDGMCKDKKNMAGIWKAALLPIRTDSEFVWQDLLFPTLINGVIKTHKASSVTLILIAVIWDILTLAVRLVTLLPRMYVNNRSTPSEHPLIPFLRGKGLDPLVTDGEVSIRVYKEERPQGSILQEGKQYMLNLSNREVPFVQSSTGFSSVSLV